MKDRYPRRGWDRHREEQPPYSDDGAWNQSWIQDPYADYRIGQPPSFYDWRQPARHRRPGSIQAAVVLMCVGAGLFGLSVVYNLVAYHAGAVYGASTLSGGTPGSAEIASAVSGIGSYLGSVIEIAIWLWMAMATSAGRTGARSLATLLFVVGTVGLAIFLFAFRADWHLISGQGPLSKTLVVGMLTAVVFWVLRLAIVVLLWRRESSDYFDAKAAGW
jgi:hypothetical protein